MQAAHFIHGNRLELLADRLAEDLQARGLDDPMRAHVVVVAHPALGRWLQERIARRCGIAINIELPLPSTFAWDVLRACDAGLSGDSAFSRTALTWRIYARLPELATRPGFEPVRNYLGDGSDARTRHDLAVALARVFDEYMVARPEWTLAWKRGVSVLKDSDEAWQAELWRELVGTTDEPDRASLMHDVLAKLTTMQTLPPNIPAHVSVFGASFLPPLLLGFFLALAGKIRLDFYQPNPCLDYWGDVVSEREIARRRRLWRQHGRREVEDYFEVGHPLLASWGTLGREYLKAIHAPDMVIHDDDAFVMPEADHLLAWLQRGLLLLDPAHASPPNGDNDVSLQIHGCPSRRREVEVLRDRLLRLIEELPDLKPHEIVVMSPRLEEYVAYIDAVFGDSSDTLSLPYSVADAPLRRSHPLLDTFARVLDLGNSRFGVGEILGLLSEAAIMRRFELDENSLDWVRTWIRESGIRWGLDASFREEVGAAALNANTWRFGLDRLLLGYAQGDEALVHDGVVPAANVEGSAAQALGQLARFIDTLDRCRREMAQARSAEAWKRWLNDTVDVLFESESEDSAEQAAFKRLREVIAEFANQAQPWLHDEALDFDIVHSVIGDALEETRGSRGGRFGVSFCGMVPMRNVPYRVVCVLGLNAGEFPRRQPAEGFHLMRRHPHAGDRSVREDDRFLFLESVGAARDALCLSYVDRDERAGTISPPSPLVEELLGFLREQYLPDRWNEIEAALVHHHPLHAFAAACYGEDSPSSSYDTRWLVSAQAAAGDWQQARSFVGARSTAFDAMSDVHRLESESGLVTDAPNHVELETLLGWLRHPARTYFQQTLQLRPPQHEGFEDVEPFRPDALTRYALVERLLDPSTLRPDIERARGEGIFPLGPVGDAAWEDFTARADALERASLRLNGVLHLSGSEPVRSMRAGAEDTVLTGAPRLVFDGRERILLLRRPGRIRGLDLARLALERALLAANGESLPAYAIGWEKDVAAVLRLEPLADVRTWLADLLRIHREGMRRPLPLFRHSAEAYASTLAHGARKLPGDAAREAWEEAPYPERDDPYDALVARNHDDPLGEEFRRLSETLFLPLYLATTVVKP
ncbi:exodeoxyribonuclease V subunit gamma [Dokdonella sp.]|uniref:exodeoxyribonuclease V subunit gamma n=1 Tax=Dokdonella sp. TaxID=2291710 RepID=UPI003527EB0F